MAMSMGGGSGPKSDINMTPMIDVLLVLIIVAAISAVAAFFFLPVKWFR